MAQSNFFRHSFFHLEDDNPAKQSSNQVIEPWTLHEAIPTQASKIETHKKPIEPPHEKTIIKRRPSNLLPQRSMAAKQIELLPPVLSGKIEGSKQLRSQLKLRGMPVQQFLIQRRQEREQEEAMHRRSIELINESLQSSFLARRLRKRGSFGYSNTIDIQRDLFQPLQIYRSQQVVQISPERNKKRREAGSSLSKYLPIRSERYQL